MNFPLQTVKKICDEKGAIYDTKMEHYGGGSSFSQMNGQHPGTFQQQVTICVIIKRKRVIHNKIFKAKIMTF